MKPSISIIGAGKVGNTLARLWNKADYQIHAVYSRTHISALTLAKAVDAIAATSMIDAITADLIILTVPDDAIESVVTELMNADWHGRGIIHTSGAQSLELLQPLVQHGAMIGSLHPAFPFADVDTAILNLHGATFAIESNHEKLRNWLLALTQTVNGQVIEIPPDSKARYHAALVIASNYTVTLYAVAQQLLQSLTHDEAAINNALDTLVAATIANIRHQGIPDALTGPLSRADTGTIQSHIDAIDDDIQRQLYITLAQATLPLLQQRGINTHTLENQLQDDT